eukprot:1194193-Prorocentrum_minimum.AAC.5
MRATEHASVILASRTGQGVSTRSGMSCDTSKQSETHALFRRAVTVSRTPRSHSGMRHISLPG